MRLHKTGNAAQQLLLVFFVGKQLPSWTCYAVCAIVAEHQEKKLFHIDPYQLLAAERRVMPGLEDQNIRGIKRRAEARFTLLVEGSQQALFRHVHDQAAMAKLIQDVASAFKAAYQYARIFTRYDKAVKLIRVVQYDFALSYRECLWPAVTSSSPLFI